MIKFVFAAIWICAVTIGAVFYSFQTTQAKQNETPPAPFFGGLDFVRTDIITVPVVKDSGVRGYFLARLVYTVEPEKLKSLSMPAEVLFVDQVYDHLYANPQIDWTDRKSVDLDAFKTSLRDSINERVGDKLIHEVMIEQVDFLSKAEIRDNALRRRIGPAENETPAATAH
ncbi:MAG TPA: hypothetical protein VFT89_10980 [Rhizobiaceae bacterium]|nr:hypothetical protein [Rhizobiaceae bacterium]